MKSLPGSGLRVLVVALVVLHPASPAMAAEPSQSAPVLDLSKMPEPSQLAALVWAHSPDLAYVRARAGLAEADVTRAGLFVNPSFDFGWAGIAVGQTNPAGLTLRETPNYTATLSQTFELGKRGPRMAAANAALRAVRFDVTEALRGRFIDVQVRAAEVASAQVRIQALGEAAADAAKLTVLQQSRASQGDTSGLDSDRARLEEQKILSGLGEARENLQTALIECAHASGLTCLPFAGPETAQAFLEKARDLEPAAELLSERPDLKSLQAQRESADEQATLAARRAIPDPILRVGYMRDQLVIAGNQPNNLFVGVTVPLPVFDHGQADSQAAHVQAEAAERTRGLLSEIAKRDVERLLRQLELAKKRQETLNTQTLPLARQVVEALAKTVLVGGAPIQDLLLARRTLQELTVDSADVDLRVFRVTLDLDRVTGRGAPHSLAASLLSTPK